MTTMSPPSIAPVVQQHAEEAAILRGVRGVSLRSPHVQLHRLRRLDDRIAAHLDGLYVAGVDGFAAMEQTLADPTAGAIFALAVCALQSKNAPWLTRLVSLVAAVPELERGLMSAMGWVSAEDLQGTVRALLGSKVPVHRAWALAACAMHRVDPGVILTQAVTDADATVRVSAWRAAGQLGRRDLIDAARQAIVATPEAATGQDPHATVLLAASDPSTDAVDAHAVRRAAAWALTLWGAGQNDLVRQALLTPLPGLAHACAPALRLAALAAPIDWGRDQVRHLAVKAETSAPHKRRMMRLAGWVGDPQVVPWLIKHMADDAWARLAAEAFSMITAADIALLDLERQAPQGLEPGPNDDPEDHNVALDEDDSLPWPDQAKVQAWWQANASRFAAGQRYFAGAPPSAEHAIHVLKTAGQRQRIMAAEYLCLLRPGSPMFPVAAPAWRQSRWLAAGA